MKSKDSPLIVERTLEFSKETVWNAITQIDQMKQWFFEQIKTFEPVVGFETSFVVKSGDIVFPHLWRITEVIPENKIVYSWKYEGYAGNSFVTFEVNPQDNGTQLKITNDIVEDFTEDIPEFKPESCLAGWEYFLNRLDLYLQNM